MIKTIEANYAKIKNNIEKDSNGLNSPKIIAVTKSVGLPEMQCLIDLGLSDFAENRIEVAEEKKTHFLSNKIVWHFIGKIQSRKVKKIVHFADIIHSVDSLKIAQKINDEAALISKKQKVLIQINIAEEDQKSGFSKEEFKQVCAQLKEMKHLQIMGLMTMAPLSTDEALIRNTFRDLNRLSKEHLFLFSQEKPELSMGMTNDYQIATQEGATMLRIGSAFFETERN